jgi:Ca2+-dependent lipid-binding protein
VREARDLPPADSNGLSDPFFWLFFNNHIKKESSVLFKTLTPKWDAVFEL